MKENIFRILKGKIWIVIILLMSVNGVFAEEVDLFSIETDAVLKRLNKHVVKEINIPHSFKKKYENLVNYIYDFTELLEENDYKGHALRKDCDFLNNFLRQLGEEKSKKIVLEYFIAKYKNLKYMTLIQGNSPGNNWRIQSMVEQLCYHYNFFSINQSLDKWNFLINPLMKFKIKNFHDRLYSNITNSWKNCDIEVSEIGGYKVNVLAKAPAIVNNKEMKTFSFKKYFKDINSSYLLTRARGRDFGFFVKGVTVFSNNESVLPENAIYSNTSLEEYVLKIANVFTDSEYKNLNYDLIKNKYAEILGELKE